MIALNSLRQTALVWITVLLALVGLATLVISYQLAKDQAAEFLDGQLRQVALNVGMGLPDAAQPLGLDQDPEDQLAVTIWNADGSIAHASPPDVDIPRQSRVGFMDLKAMGLWWRVYTATNGERMVRVAQRIDVRDEIARGAALGATAPVLILIPLSWLVVGWSVNRTLGRLNTFATDIAARGVSAAAPIPLDKIPTEVVPVVKSMNGLIERLRGALDAQKRFLADAAHELRTPLAAMQIEVEGLSSATIESLAERRNALARGMRRASALVDQLLQLARLDELAPFEPEKIAIAQLVLDCVGDHVVIADRKGVDLGVDAPVEASLLGSREELRVLFSNLIENAVRYTPAGGTVDVSVKLLGALAVVEVLDSGCGLPHGAEARVFDRFYRGAPETEGSGLGLAIAQRVAERNGLALTVENRSDGRPGVMARVELSTDATRNIDQV
jgi:two-component system, OmpR family, sensor kinase